MASPIGSHGSVDVKVDGKGSSIPIEISEPAGVKAENLSLSTWGASFVLANHLHKIDLPSGNPDHPEYSILELGAGTGLVGLAAATVWGANVVLTDLPSILPGLEANIQLNASLLSKRGAKATCGCLDWSSPTEIRQLRGNTVTDDKILQAESTKTDLILAADTIYDEDHPELLSNTILMWLAKGEGSRVILCYPLRMAYIDHVRFFWSLMEEGGLECIEEGREQGDENWNEIVNTPYEWCVWAWKALKP